MTLPPLSQFGFCPFHAKERYRDEKERPEAERDALPCERVSRGDEEKDGQDSLCSA
jgi:hypothetical protein